MKQDNRRRFSIKISGMTCATCVETIKNALAKINGVKNVTVNLGSETAVVEYDRSQTSLKDLHKAVEDAGYGVVNENAALRIGGMTCAMCVNTIEKALKNKDGLVNVNVNLGAEKAYVTFNPSLLTVMDMKKTIEDVGYQFLGVEGEESKEIEERAHEKDLRGKRLRFILGFTVGIPLMILMYLRIDLPFSLPYFMLIVTTPVFVYISYPIFWAAYRALKNRSLNMDVMYSMGIGTAFIASLMGTFQIVLTREFLFYEAALMLASFLTFGRYLESRAKGKTSEAIKQLIRIQPKQATVIRQGREQRIAIENVIVDDIVIVKPGERLPVDGVVTDGASYVDESMITGESIPNLKKQNSAVVGGTINKNSALRVKATRIGKDTVLAQIIRLVEAAQGSRPPVQRIADRVVRYFIPVVLSIATLSFIIWYFVAGSTLLFALTRFISVLVIACPCALGLATPTAVTVGIGRGAELGILIKNGEALELSERIKTMIFDKTGTLTKGRPEVTDLLPFGNDDNGLLEIAASLERNSQHPVAEAIVSRAQSKGLVLSETKDFDTIEGQGVKGKINGQMVFAGNPHFMEVNDIAYPAEVKNQVTQIEQAGKSTVLIALGKQLVGVIGVADTIKQTSYRAIQELKDMDIELVMLTGDNEHTAQTIAHELGISEVRAEVLPQEKAHEVMRIQERGRLVSFVGDGINDAPALAQADVGIATGSGTDIAIESGDIILMQGEMIDAAAAIQLGKKVMSRIKQNLFWAFAYNTALIPVAAGLLYPFLGITFRPELAGFAMAMSSVTVVTLSLLLKRYVPAAKKQERR
jgi:Cu+-exporting ATPase